MKEYLILCVDDERDVLDSVLQDLSDFEDNFILEGAESVAEAKEVIQEQQRENVPLALILCDHIMPGETGVSFLIQLNENEDTHASRKILLTGQAGHEDTIEAVNHSCLDFYITKPWRGDELRDVIKQQLTTFMIKHEPELMPWARILDTERVFDALSKNRINYGD
ncbi:response regulator [Vibrio methylphosphonaticus]|uniref:response regulator n=1 Tax=Vibrio methylphosphonaticus TaxID=2946866 RepID=UPI002029CEF7|nr:response regulator [Vibrio methylphosphonaticus]MCL9774834.1 response regulator [Vibrio methylphosphonaticus]